MIESKYYIRAVVLIGLEDLVGELGCNLRDLLDELEISQDVLTNVDQLLSFRKVVLLLELVAIRTNTPNFGLLWAQKSSPEFPHVGPLLLLARFVDNLREWIDTGIKYWSFHTNGYNVELIAPSNCSEATLRMVGQSNFNAAPQFSEHVLGLLVDITRIIGNFPERNPTTVYFQHRRPKNCALHDEIFRCPVVFGAEHNEIVFDAAFLDLPTVGGLRIFKPLMSFYVSERIKRIPNFDLTAAATVALAIPSLIGTGNCNLENVAEALNKNTKQLQRQLTAEGTSFSEILEEARLELAKNLLCHSTAQISRIAGMLDYAGSPPFTLAFRRWTGQSPLEFRKRYQLNNPKVAP
jgi:AraC-like DNA-binding protein